MKYLGIIIFLIFAVIIITLGATKVPEWLGFKKTEEVSKIEVPAKKPVVKKPTPTIQTAPQPTTGYLPSVPDSAIPYGFKREQLSPYFGKINISTVSYYTWGNYPAYITLSSSLPPDEKISITGWRIKSNLETILIPQTIEVYDPSGFSSSVDIIFKAYQTVSFYSSFSPIGQNFRLNKCIGYLEEIYDFSPPLPRNCPYINRAEISGLSGTCQNYILSLSSCQMPAPNPPISPNDEACWAYLNTLNYRGCFDRYRRDTDFLSSEWKVWMGRINLDSSHDRLLLFDKNNLLVDEYSY
jgi:hypothetical protein